MHMFIDFVSGHLEIVLDTLWQKIMLYTKIKVFILPGIGVKAITVFHK